LIRIAAIGALVAQQAGAWPDILSLVTEPGGALPHVIIPMLAKVIAPRIGVILRLVIDQGLGVDPAAVGRVLAATAERDPTGEVAVAPIHERLRVGVGRPLRHRKSDFGVDREIGATALAFHA